MALTPQQVEATVVANAAALGLHLPTEYRGGVLAFFALAAGMAELVNAQPLTIEDEPAPVFVPVSPRDGS
jgi:1-carboxybiuret hydrolase subunit AtzG-like protein